MFQFDGLVIAGFGRILAVELNQASQRTERGRGASNSAVARLTRESRPLRVRVKSVMDITFLAWQKA
jgi:hypothetical protein